MESDAPRTGIIIVDHGSKRAASNDMLLEVVDLFRRLADYGIVEPAHMELAEPSIATAFDRCVQQGAARVILHPYFLLPGKHWAQDIPALAAEAAENHPGLTYLVTQPLGLHEKMVEIMTDRIDHCLAHAAGEADSCPACAGTDKCRLRTAEGEIIPTSV